MRNRSITLVKLSVALLPLVLAMLACGYTPLQTEADCPRITFSEFREKLDSRFATEESLEQWIMDSYGDATTTIKAQYQSDLMRDGVADGYFWHTTSTGYNLSVQDLKPRTLWGGWGGSFPSLGHAIECIGEPSSYIATFIPTDSYMPPTLVIQFFYPESGIVFSAIVALPYISLADGPVAYRLDRRASSIALVSFFVASPVSTVDELFDADVSEYCFSTETDNAKHACQALYESMLPWPGDAHDLIFETPASP